MTAPTPQPDDTEWLEWANKQPWPVPCTKCDWLRTDKGITDDTMLWNQHYLFHEPKADDAGIDMTTERPEANTGQAKSSRGDTGEAIDHDTTYQQLYKLLRPYDVKMKVIDQLQELIRGAFNAGLSKGFDTLIMDEQTAWDEWQKEGGLSSGQTDGWEKQTWTR